MTNLEQLISDGVVASYIHDISRRRRRYPTSSRTRGATSSPRRRTNPTASSSGTPTSSVENGSSVAMLASCSDHAPGSPSNAITLTARSI